MLIGFRLTRQVVVNVIVGVILLRLLCMGIEGLDRFSDSWYRVAGASMEGSVQVQESSLASSEHIPDEADLWLSLPYGSHLESPYEYIAD